MEIINQNDIDFDKFATDLMKLGLMQEELKRSMEKEGRDLGEIELKELEKKWDGLRERIRKTLEKAWKIAKEFHAESLGISAGFPLVINIQFNWKIKKEETGE